MTKVDGRTKQSAARQIDESLKRLPNRSPRSPPVSRGQFRLEDPDRIFAPAARWRRILRRGSGQSPLHRLYRHKDPFVHLRMLDIAEQHDFRSTPCRCR